jgi:hypothetical protein
VPQPTSNTASPGSTDYVRPENLRAAQFAREDFRGLTMADVERQAEHMPWGTPDEVAKRIIDAADSAGADTVQVSLNRGVLLHEMFIEQIRRFARDVCRHYRSTKVTRVPLAEPVPVLIGLLRLMLSGPRRLAWAA